MRRPLQRRRPIHVNGVDVRALLEERPHRRRVLVLHRGDQPDIRLGLSRTAQAERCCQTRQGDERSDACYTSIRPELCPNWSVLKPALSMTEIIRFESGVLFAILMWRFP